jgi:hypothetical protein
METLCRRMFFVLFLLVSFGLPAQDASQITNHHVGRVMDWSSRHVIVSGGLSDTNLDSAAHEPRVLFRLAERNLVRASGNKFEFHHREDPGRHDSRRETIDDTSVVTMKKNNLKVDWSVSLGGGIVAPNMFPAKYSFDITAAPSCTNDYVVFGLNVNSAGGQANLLGITNLYSGTAPTGICGTAPTVNWAYRGSTAAGRIITSPAISLDGQRFAYVESATTSAIFHVLTWKASQGTSATAPVVPTLNGSCTGTVAVPTSSCLKSVTFSATATDTFASPWVDYATDTAFVASDDGKIYKIGCVFTCALNTLPTVLWTYTLPVAGTGGATPRPNGPVFDSTSGLLFVGDQLGELWVINAASNTAATLSAGPYMVGGGRCTTTNPPGRTGTPAPCTATGSAYGIPDSVILDTSSQRIFAFSGNDGTAGASATVVQISFGLTNAVRVHVGLGSVGTTTGSDLHTGAFDNNYWGATPSTGQLFLCGTGPADTTPYHYWIGFDSYPVMDSVPSGSLQRYNVAGLPCAPAAEIYNPNINLGGVAGDHDLLIGGLVGANGNGWLITNDISSGAVPAGLNTVNYPGGISGVAVDNTSTSAQASSIYFSTQGSVSVGTCNNTRCAVKLTQLSLQ